MIRIAGGMLAIAGLGGALARPLLDIPGAFPVLGICALVLWFVGTATAASCLAPPRPISGAAAISAAVLAWPLLFVSGAAPLWGGLSLVCGVLIAAGAQERFARADTETPTP
ncbi:MAG: hypothetical protein H6531_10995 [Actinobacteria bacterium]|nr:hypothetical protein [Thermoleophilia bacterium]MCB9012339.1 hypothetical protein [Actinomycetota bacterium]